MARCKSATIYFMRCFILALALTMSAVWNVNAQTLTLRAADTFTYKDSLGVVYSTNWTDSITGNPADSIAGGYWKGTFWEADTLTFCDFRISHTGSVYIGDSTITNYWHGFTTGANGDNTNYGYHDTAQHVGSVKWIDNQWGVMAGGGLTTSPSAVPDGAAKGQPYFVAYWNFYTQDYIVDLDAQTLKVEFTDSSLFTPQSVYICSHPWPYYGNYFGDGFARPLNRPGDYFVLRIRGIDDSGKVIETTVVDTLAKADPCSFSGVRQCACWHRVDLSVFPELSAIYFTMESTDADPVWGPNTAVYFCMDSLTVTKEKATLAKPVVRKVKTTTEKAPKGAEVKDYFSIPSHTGGEVTVHDAKGKVALKTSVKAGEKVNLSKLPKGEYRLRHGHRVIPVTKK